MNADKYIIINSNDTDAYNNDNCNDIDNGNNNYIKVNNNAIKINIVNHESRLVSGNMLIIITKRKLAQTFIYNHKSVQVHTKFKTTMTTII